MAVYKDEKQKTYYYHTWVTYPDGTKKQKKKRGFKTKRDAQLAESAAIEEAKNFRPEEKKMLFSVLAEDYLKWYKLRRKDSSYRKISSIVEVHLIPKFGKKAIDKIRPKHIMDYHSELIPKYSPAHVTKIHTVLSAVFNYGVKQEHLKENPARLAGNAEVEIEKHVNYWTLEEFRRFVEVVDDEVYYALFMTLYYSGMRKGELLALTWGDIDLDNNTINVDKTEYYRVITKPKTKASIRTLLMPKHVMTLLSRLKAKRDPKMTYRVFGEFNDSISTSTLDITFHRYIKKAKVKKIRIHDFRHSHASYLINNNVIVSVVAKRLGHGDVATTLNTYSHLYPSTEKEAVLAMEDDFKSAKLLKMIPN